jgi:membrane-associated phospholipid phosphatase
MNYSQKHRYKGNETAMPWQGHPVPERSRGHLPALDLRHWGGALVGFRPELAAACAACGTFEYVALGYLGLSSALIVIFAENLAHPVRLLSLQVLAAAVILALCGTQVRIGLGESLCPTAAQKFWHFWRHWYPHLFFLFCFEELGHLVHLVSPGWSDTKLIAFDYWLTGVHPAIWLEQFATPARNDFMQFAYITYFTYLLALGGILYYRKDWRGYWSVMTYSAVGYAIGYVIAIFFPIESPWFSMAGSWHAELRGGPFTALINFIEHYGRVRGAAFPSEHVAGSFAALWGAWRHRRWLFWVMLPLVLCMCVSTVYGRYHYVADIFAGMITGTLGYVLGSWLMKETAVKSSLECGSSVPLLSRQPLRGQPASPSGPAQYDRPAASA